MRVTYHPQTKKTKTSGNAVLSNKASHTIYEQLISIKNTRLSRLRPLLVKEQLPVSLDAKVKVSIIEPKGLSFPSSLLPATKKLPRLGSTGDVSVGAGIIARWVPRDDGRDNSLLDSETMSGTTTSANNDTGNEAAQGLMEWVCDVAPGANIDLTLSWEIVVPSGTMWTRY